MIGVFIVYATVYILPIYPVFTAFIMNLFTRKVK